MGSALDLTTVLLMERMPAIPALTTTMKMMTSISVNPRSLRLLLLIMDISGCGLHSDSVRRTLNLKGAACGQHHPSTGGRLTQPVEVESGWIGTVDNAALSREKGWRFTLGPNEGGRGRRAI